MEDTVLLGSLITGFYLRLSDFTVKLTLLKFFLTDRRQPGYHKYKLVYIKRESAGCWKQSELR
jgi:hypothetical protein